MNNELFQYQKLQREIDDKIKFIQSSNPVRNSKDSINLIKLRMMKKDTERKWNEQNNGSLKNLFNQSIQ